MVEIQNKEQELRNELLPNVVAFVDGTVATLNFTEETEYTQDQIRELISLFVDVYEHMDINIQEEKEENMNLFDDDDLTEEVETVEVNMPTEQAKELSPNQTEVNDTGELLQLVGNVTAFLYMTEDYAENRLGKNEIVRALYILRDSITTYLESAGNDTDDNKAEQQE